MQNLITIPCLNHWAFTKLCIDSVLASTDSRRDRVLVFDNGSTDPTSKGLQVYGDKIQVHREAQNIGVYHALNKVMNDYLGEQNLIVVANDHVMLPGWVDKLLASESHLGLGAYSPMVIDTGVTDILRSYQQRRNKMRNDWFNGKPNHERVDIIKRYLAELYQPHGGMEKFRQAVVSQASSLTKPMHPWPGVCFYSNEVIRKVGFFDERYGMWGAADVDYFYRISGVFDFPCRLTYNDYAHHFGSITIRKAAVGYTDLGQQDYSAKLVSKSTDLMLSTARARALGGVNEYFYKGQLHRSKVK